jgi:spore coat polysaccharide biosynthesis protein SpsF (cytidylyltransferase family)
MIYRTADGVVNGHTWFVVPDCDPAIIDHLQNVKNYRWMMGPLEPLKRYVKCAHALGASHIMRLTADCPYIDEAQILLMTRILQNTGADFVSNCHPEDRHTVDGNDCEIMSMKCLEWLDTYAQLEDREHVTAHLYKHPKYTEKAGLSTIFYRPAINWFKLLKTSVDTPEDLVRVREACL